MLHKTKYITNIDFDGLLKYLSTMDRNQRIEKYWANNLSTKYNKIGIPDDVSKQDATDLVCPNYFSRDKLLKDNDKRLIDEISFSFNHFRNINQKVDVIYCDDSVTVFKYCANKVTVIPTEFITFEEAKNYDALTCNEIESKLIGNSKALVIKSDMSYETASNKYEQSKQELEQAEVKAKQELEAFRQEMYKQELALKEKHEAMLAELRAIKDKFEDQIFVLEMNIFALRSFFGETYTMQYIQKGNNAPDEQVLVISQKFRYLDEEFARLAGLTVFDSHSYNIDNVFTNCKDLVNVFCPSLKCITFFKVSKNNRTYNYNRDFDCLEQFGYLHGNQIGMLIRNGENIYLSFIDEEVTLRDNLFVSKGSSSEETPITQNTKVRDKEARPLFSRKLIFLILQQIINNSNIFSNMKGEDIFNSSKILLADADNQIVTYKYPSFADFFDNANDRGVIIGDNIFITQNHRGSKSTGNPYYEEHRGVGYRNTASDADIEQGISKINLIINNPDGYKYKEKESDKYWRRSYLSDSSVKDFTDKGYIVEPVVCTHYYVSCPREVYGEDYYKERFNVKRINNANLKIYNDEFMTVMWLNSNYVKEWIDSKHIGSWREGDYAYFVNKLKELKKFLEEREEQEFTYLSKYMNIKTYSSELKDKVLNWRIENKVRRINDFQAKRFAKSMV